MKRFSSMIRGECHCGNLSFEFQTNYSPEELVVRSCQCRFCKVHGAATARDPDGMATITVRVPEKVALYRFATKSTDFILCSTCGVYIGAAITFDGNVYATLNMNVSNLSLTEVVPIVHDAESRRLRVQRRVKTFTPLVNYPF